MLTFRNSLCYSFFAVVTVFAISSCASEQVGQDSPPKMELTHTAVERPVEPTKDILGSSRKLLSSNRLTKSEIEAGAINHAKLYAVESSDEKANSNQAKSVEPKVVFCKLANYEKFNSVRKLYNGRSLNIDEPEVWVIEVRGQFKPIARSVTSNVDTLVLAVTPSGVPISRIELSKSRREKILDEHKKSRDVNLTSLVEM